MSHIDIRYDHTRTPEQARSALEQAACKLDQRFGLQSHWSGDRLSLSGSGIEGVIELLPGQIHVTATLGFLLSAMTGMVETEIRRVLSEKLDAPA